MKIVLDLSDLVERGQLTTAEAARLRSLAASNASTFGINLLVGFGLVAVVAGVGALVPTITTAIVLGAVLAVAGFALQASVPKTWDLLAHFCVVVGSLSFCGGLIALDDGALRAVLFAVVALTALGVLVNSGLLVALAVLAVGIALGSSTDYSHAFYALSVEQPALTILVFAVIAFAAMIVSLRVPARHERLALIAARVAVIAVNFGFWVGSLFGDNFGRVRAWLEANPALVNDHSGAGIPAGAFAAGWAIALVAVGAWALRENRMWVVNVVAVFGAIDFYTQWFERLGADPVAVLGAGILTLAVALALWRFNRSRAEPQAA